MAIPLLALGGGLAVDDRRALTVVHVMAGVLWTGVDVFVGAVFGPVLGGLDPDRRAAFFRRSTPRMTFPMPTLATVTIIGGAVLAVETGRLPDPHPWLAMLPAVTSMPIGLLVGYQLDAL